MNIKISPTVKSPPCLDVLFEVSRHIKTPETLARFASISSDTEFLVERRVESIKSTENRFYPKLSDEWRYWSWEAFYISLATEGVLSLVKLFTPIPDVSSGVIHQALLSAIQFDHYLVVEFFLREAKDLLMGLGMWITEKYPDSDLGESISSKSNYLWDKEYLYAAFDWTENEKIKKLLGEYIDS